jgi:hypothetical protein
MHMKRPSIQCLIFCMLVFAGACSSSQAVKSDGSTTPTDDQSCSEKLAKAPCGNPNWNELPPGGAPEEEPKEVREKAPEQP